MGSNFNFMNFGNDRPVEGGRGGRPPGNIPLTQQSSMYSLTFDEFQSTVGGIGKDFGSMNMDELLKNIWSAEENQNIGSTSGGVNGQVGGGYLQKQGSLTLPRTLSQKTVDEVWRDVSKEYGSGKDASSVIGGFSMPQRQPTLGEVTLEEFLVRAGAVRAETPLAAKPNNVGYFSDMSRHLNSSGLEIGYQQGSSDAGLIGNRIAENTNQIAVQPANLPLNVNGVRSAAQQLVHQPHRQQQQLLPKQAALDYGAPMRIPNNQLGSPRIRGGIVGLSDAAMKNSAVQHLKLPGEGLGMVNLGVTATVSPAVSSDGLTKNNGDTSSVSPVPCVFNDGLRGRKRAGLEKVVERRQRRMIKNRESAARSRARKQAYTMELEAEIAKLKERNDELRKKQAEMMEIQKNQVLEMINQQKGAKRRCLRRTQTSPW